MKNKIDVQWILLLIMGILVIYMLTSAILRGIRIEEDTKEIRQLEKEYDKIKDARKIP